MTKIKVIKVGAYGHRTPSAKSRWRKTLAIIGGVFIGLATGLLGGGGGSLAVPLYQSLGVGNRSSHATAIATILPLSIIGGAIYAMRGTYPLDSAPWVTLGVVLGGMMGTVILKKINPSILSVVFYAIMIYAGIKMII